MCDKSILFAFLGGAIVGAGAALLFAPEKGEELRAKIKALCAKHGYKCKAEEELDKLVSEITQDV